MLVPRFLICSTFTLERVKNKNVKISYEKRHFKQTCNFGCIRLSYRFTQCSNFFTFKFLCSCLQFRANEQLRSNRLLHFLYETNILVCSNRLLVQSVCKKTLCTVRNSNVTLRNAYFYFNGNSKLFLIFPSSFFILGGVFCFTQRKTN